jgi:hypothetical protein
MKKSVLIIILIAVLILASVVGFMTFRHFQSGKYIAVKFSNLEEVSLIEFKTSRQVRLIEHTGDSVYINKDWRYQLKYTGSDGYASGYIDVDNSKDEVVIKPHYSDKKLESMLDTEKVALIHLVIKKSYPDVDKNYVVQKGQLHHYGEWYTTSFVYKKGYNFNSDTLYVVLKEVNGRWQTATIPSITLDRFTNPTIPVDILRQVNNSSS